MNIKDIESLAMLARLELSDAEKKSLLADLDSILGYVKQIESLDMSETEEDYKLYNVWREDILEKRDFSLDIIKEQFPDVQDGFLKVKKIL